MVNFRYHVVSLVAVFLALAVGILLGAGPLEGPIGAGLANQVESLRQDKDSLRAELESAADRGDYADTAFAAVGGAAVTGALTGKRVALVSIGTGVDERSEQLRSLLAASGATVSADIHLEDSLLTGDPAEREALAEELAGSLDVGKGEDLGVRELVNQAVARVLRGGDAEVGDVDALWTSLLESRLVNGAITSVADAVVVVTGPYHQDPADVVPEEMTAPREETCVGLVRALVDNRLSVVVTGPDQTGTDLVRRLEDDQDLREAVSAVSVPVPGAEAIADVWALAADLDGRHGAYGARGEPFPPAPPPPAPEESS
jgi:hypothetical protein